ncbi:hypothetical protein C9426_01515 [Serratia sp. S1B]|nr:hypothetical protein C9426_01515 [Serratia sp. S1B]
MTKSSAADLGWINSLTWYMSARKTVLRAALTFRTPISVLDQIDMRVHYSSYFLNLMAAIDIFDEITLLKSSNFKEQLYSSFSFNGFPNGEANYSYIRELRNAVVHRGLDLTSAMHITDDNFPMLLAERQVQNLKKSKTFFAFGTYLLDIIQKCESIIGPVMLDCLKDLAIFETNIDIDAAINNYYQSVEQSQAIPEPFKAMAKGIEFQPEWVEMVHASGMKALCEALMAFNITNELELNQIKYNL